MSQSVHKDHIHSGFTAVNGRSATQTQKLSGNGTERRHSAEDKRPPGRDTRLSSPGKRKRTLSLDHDDPDFHSRRMPPGPRPERYSLDESSSEVDDENVDEDNNDDDEDGDDDDDNDDDNDAVEPLDKANRDSPLRPGDFHGPSLLNGHPVHDEATNYANAVVEGIRPTDPGMEDLQNAEARSMDPSRRQLDRASNDYSSTTEITRAGVQVDRKKRKRVFSNRTKTGCLTCRRRKKKCDEAKPECNNCSRGGFFCEGYILKTSWMKPGLPKSHVPLQSKQGIYPRLTGESYPEHSIGRPRVRAVPIEDNPSHAWTAWRPPPLDRGVDNEVPRTVGRSEPQRPAEQYGERSSYASTPHAMTPSQQVSTSQSAMTAQLALQHQSSTASPASQSEKEKMLSGQYFLPFSPQLMEEREQCRMAQFRLNNVMSTLSGPVAEERMRLFRELLDPPHMRGAADGVEKVGKDVVLDGTFHCEYGYNIVIGDEVAIGTGCTFMDSGRVRIGSRVVLGSNVRIYTLEYNKNTKERKGTKELAQAQEVKIGDGALIDSDVTIMPGAVIESNAIVKMGAVVPKGITKAPAPGGEKATTRQKTPSYARVPTR